MTNLSSPWSRSICSVSSRDTPLLILALMAPLTMSYTFFDAYNFVSMLGLGSQGNNTLAGVVDLSSLSYRFLRRATTSGSSAISWQARHRTVVWNNTCTRDKRRTTRRLTTLKNHLSGACEPEKLRTAGTCEKGSMDPDSPQERKVLSASPTI